ncbi:protein kinase family protein [Agrococcus jejuensis]|uniref:hypothetical protein n=1 Tax=Agrococcus jejuensis TaxID=399736 RepID=UPI0015608C2F|nr:hypothetical protein [Agrococcus jejuensis]
MRDAGERRVLAGYGDAAVELHVGTGTAAAELAGEAEVLLRVAHPHVLPVLDVATHDGAVVLVRPRSAATAAEWLLARGVPRAGEVVTLVAPVLDAVATLHAAGATAGRVDLHAIVLDDDGAPAIAGAGAVQETTRPTAAWRDGSEGVAADCAALAALVDDLLATCDEHAPAAVREGLAARDVAAASAALLAAWPALPIERTRSEPAAQRRQGERRRVRSDADAPLPVRWLQAALERVAPVVASVRRPVWIAAGAGAAALVVALVLGGGGASVADETPVAVADAPDATPVATTRPSSESTAVDAAGALLAAREACLDAADAACLADILDPTGGAAAATWRLPADAALREVAVLGDAVLVDVASSSEPASVLVVRTDAGWMLRDAWAA